MLKFKKSDLIIMGAMLVLIGCLGAVIFSYKGKVDTIVPQRQAKEAELKMVRSKVATFPQLREKVARREAEFQQVADYLPSQEGQAEFIAELDNLDRQCGTKLISCSVTDAPKPFPNLAEYEIYEWKVSYQANYSQLLKMLEELPQQKRSTMVSDIAITYQNPDENAGSASKYSLNVQLTYNLISTTGQKKVVQ